MEASLFCAETTIIPNPVPTVQDVLPPGACQGVGPVIANIEHRELVVVLQRLADDARPLGAERIAAHMTSRQRLRSPACPSLRTAHIGGDAVPSGNAQRQRQTNGRQPRRGRTRAHRQWLGAALVAIAVAMAATLFWLMRRVP